MKFAALCAILLIGGVGASSGQAPGEVHKPGSAVTTPVLVSEVKPTYTAEALRRRIRGTVKLACIVETDGSVSNVRVITPLDEALDGQAVAALTRWRFKPGLREGKAVRTLVEVEMSFTIGSGPRLDSAEVHKPGATGVLMPTLLKEVKPEYPLSKRGSGIQGIVTLDCVVLPDGSVGDVRVARGLDPDLDQEAIRSMRQWRFKPGQKDGKPVPVQVSVEIAFTLK
jgi:protein TonB